MVLVEGIEPSSVPCKDTALPLDETSWWSLRDSNPLLLNAIQQCYQLHQNPICYLVPNTRIELVSIDYQSNALPLS